MCLNSTRLINVKTLHQHNARTLAYIFVLQQVVYYGEEVRAFRIIIPKTNNK